MQKKILYLFTRTPLHVGAGASVGAIDLPIIRERHTGFPVIPASSLKGTFSDEWNERVKVKRKKQDGSEEEVEVIQRSADGKWLFGETDANNAAAGALQFTEARLLAFPIRSARGSFAWITCPLILERASRDGLLDKAWIPQFPKPPNGQPDNSDDRAFFAANGPLALGDKVVLEEYTFTHTGDLPQSLREALKNLLPEDPVWHEVQNRLVVLRDGMMSFFVRNACEVAQHVRISDETGTAEGGGLFNQENVPSETMFYSVLHALNGRSEKFKDKTPDHAFEEFAANLNAKGAVFQFGGDASTGLGYCTVKLANNQGA